MTSAMQEKQEKAFSTDGAPVILDGPLLERYLDSLKDSDLKPQTVRAYQRAIGELGRFLGEEGTVTQDALDRWRIALKVDGYSDSTVNQYYSAVNGFLRFCGREELSMPHERIEAEEAGPEMTRTEYLKFLSAAREAGTENEYFLIKVFGSVDLCIGELDCLTLEACREGRIHLPDGRESVIPSCLREELLAYAQRHRIKGGPLFVTHSGHPLDRSNITNAIRRLAIKVGISPEACCPRALHRMYQTTQRELLERLQPLCLQSYENLLETEQTIVAWKNG